MNRLLGCIMLLGGSLAAQSVQSTLLALKDSHAARKALSNELVNEMMALAHSDQRPSRATVQRFSEDLTSALVGKDVTTIRAAALQKGDFRRTERQRIDVPARVQPLRHAGGLQDR